MVPLCHVVVINLMERADRLTEFRQRWSTTGIAMDVEVFAAIPGGTDGCMASHLAVLRAHAGHDGSVMVLEDDACFAPGFPYRAQPPTDWQVLWLGAQHLQLPVWVSPGWVRAGVVARTHAYIARDPADLASRFEAVDAPELDPYIGQVDVPQYVAQPQTAGQAAGTSDIDGTTRPADQYWHLFPHWSWPHLTTRVS